MDVSYLIHVNGVNGPDLPGCFCILKALKSAQWEGPGMWLSSENVHLFTDHQIRTHFPIDDVAILGQKLRLLHVRTTH